MSTQISTETQIKLLNDIKRDIEDYCIKHLMLEQGHDIHETKKDYYTKEIYKIIEYLDFKTTKKQVKLNNNFRLNKDTTITQEEYDILINNGFKNSTWHNDISSSFESMESKKIIAYWWGQEEYPMFRICINQDDVEKREFNEKYKFTLYYTQEYYETLENVEMFIECSNDLNGLIDIYKKMILKNRAYLGVK